MRIEEDKFAAKWDSLTVEEWLKDYGVSDKDIDHMRIEWLTMKHLEEIEEGERK